MCLVTLSCTDGSFDKIAGIIEFYSLFWNFNLQQEIGNNSYMVSKIL